MIKEFLNFLADTGFKKKNSAASRARKLACLKSFFKYAHREGFVRDNPSLDIITPRGPEKEPTFLTEDEYKRLLKATAKGRTSFQRKRDYAIISLFLATGARLNELTGLDVGDIDLKDKTVKLLRKGGGEQVLPLSDELIEILKGYLRIRRKRTRTRALFISSRNRKIDNNTVWHIVRRNAKIARINKSRVSPHSLRHSFATHLLSMGESLKTIQTLLNHRNISTTAKYLHTQDIELKEAVNKIKLS